MTYWYQGVQETIQLLRTVFPVPILLGGRYAPLLPEYAKSIAVDRFWSVQVRQLLERSFSGKLESAAPMKGQQSLNSSPVWI
jgi:hypothetical protein